ncbi:MAG: WecB/TagA/CpsF family glycosyltransferase [Patescibacteria group bacterium]
MTTVKILDIPISAVTYGDVLLHIEDYIASGKPHHIITVNPEIILHSQKNETMRKALLSSSLNTPDGIGLIWASKFNSLKQSGSLISNIPIFLVTAFAVVCNKKWLSSQLPMRVTGIDLVEQITKKAYDTKWKILFLGAKDGAAQLACNTLSKKYNIPTNQFISSDLNPTDPEAIKAVKDFKPDILLVAYGSPKQEIFIYSNLEKLATPVVIGVGGSFDFISGKTMRAPKFMRSLSLEWLWRIILQPSRIARIVRAVVVFPLKVLLSK